MSNSINSTHSDGDAFKDSQSNNRNGYAAPNSNKPKQNSGNKPLYRVPNYSSSTSNNNYKSNENPSQFFKGAHSSNKGIRVADIDYGTTPNDRMRTPSGVPRPNQAMPLTPGIGTTPPTTPGVGIPLAPGIGTPPTPGVGMPPTTPGVGMPPTTPGVGMPPTTPGVGMPPTTPGVGVPPTTPGIGTPPTTPGVGMPPTTPGVGMPPTTPGIGMPPTTPGVGMPPTTPGIGMPRTTPGFGTPPTTPGVGMPRTSPGMGTPPAPGAGTGTTQLQRNKPNTTVMPQAIPASSRNTARTIHLNNSSSHRIDMPYRNNGSSPITGMPYINYNSNPSFPNVPNNIYMPDQNPYHTPPMGVPLFPLYGYDNSEDLDRDVDYFRQLYPNTVRSIQSAVDDECDKLEYDGSFMFDEYPDKVTLERIVDRIYERMQELEEMPQVEANSLYYGYPRRRPNYLHDIVTILLLNELFNRRRRYRSRRRWF